jgi:hypothetical protein
MALKSLGHAKITYIMYWNDVSQKPTVIPAAQAMAFESRNALGSLGHLVALRAILALRACDF